MTVTLVLICNFIIDNLHLICNGIFHCPNEEAAVLFMSHCSKMKRQVNFFLFSSILGLVTIGIFEIPLVSSSPTLEEQEEQPIEDGNDHLPETDVLVDDDENFDDLFIWTDFTRLETALEVDYNFTLEQKVSLTWKNASTSLILSALGQVSSFTSLKDRNLTFFFAISRAYSMTVVRTGFGRFMELPGKLRQK